MSLHAPDHGDPEVETEALNERTPEELRQVDTLEAQRQLVYLELFLRRREIFDRPTVQRVTIGAGGLANPEYTLPGDPRDLYNGLAIFNPTPATLSVGFAAGTGLLAPITVPPYSYVVVPARYADLSVALLNPADAAQTYTQFVTVVQLRVPPQPEAGPYGVAPEVAEQAFETDASFVFAPAAAAAYTWQPVMPNGFQAGVGSLAGPILFEGWQSTQTPCAFVVLNGSYTLANAQAQVAGPGPVSINNVIMGIPQSGVSRVVRSSFGGVLTVFPAYQAAALPAEVIVTLKIRVATR